MGVLRTILIILAIYWTVRVFTRYVVPLVLGYFVKYISRKAQENARSGGFQNYSQEEEILRDGDVTITKSTKKQSSTNTEGVGEYVDYEEVK